MKPRPRHDERDVSIVGGPAAVLGDLLLASGVDRVGEAPPLRPPASCGQRPPGPSCTSRSSAATGGSDARPTDMTSHVTACSISHDVSSFGIRSFPN
jgi:hypothetical protein